MVISLDTFINDFKNSGIIEWIGQYYDIIMVWVTGSRAVHLDDDNSDYDIGILVADKIDTPRDPEHMASGKYIKDPEKHIHLLMHTLKDVYSLPIIAPYIFYSQLGWIQFSNFDDEHTIYVNPSYTKIVDELADNKDLISKKAAYAYLTVLEPIFNVLVDGIRPEGVLSKFITYALLCLNLLTADQVPHEQLLRIKQTPIQQLTSDDFALVVAKAKIAKQVIAELKLPDLQLKSFDTWW